MVNKKLYPTWKIWVGFTSVSTFSLLFTLLYFGNFKEFWFIPLGICVAGVMFSYSRYSQNLFIDISQSSIKNEMLDILRFILIVFVLISFGYLIDDKESINISYNSEEEHH